jgi:CRP-like cAMP-binding protein
VDSNAEKSCAKRFSIDARVASGIVSGELALEWAADGCEEAFFVGSSSYLDEQGPGEYFGELGLFDGQCRSASAIATLPTACKVIDKENLRAWLVAHPGCAIALLGHAALRIRDLSDELRASMSSAYERVARFIQQVAVLEPSTGDGPTPARAGRRARERIVHAMPAPSHIARMARHQPGAHK